MEVNCFSIFEIILTLIELIKNLKYSFVVVVVVVVAVYITQWQLSEIHVFLHFFHESYFYPLMLQTTPF